jgi:hypothetical protein
MEKEVIGIFNSVLVEYNPAMTNWMKGTGGGSGAEEDFAIWEERDHILFVIYSNQPARIYISVVYIWDKQYGFPLVTQKDTVPAYAAIDDDSLFGNGDNGHDDDNEPGGGRGEERTERRGRCSASAWKEDNLISVLKEMNKQNEAANLMSAELLKIMRGDTPSIASPNPGASINAMAVGNATTSNSDKELNPTMCEMQGNKKEAEKIEGEESSPHY